MVPSSKKVYGTHAHVAPETDETYLTSFKTFIRYKARIYPNVAEKERGPPPEKQSPISFLSAKSILSIFNGYLIELYILVLREMY